MATEQRKDGRVVAITGACTFLGTELCRRLVEDRRYAKILALDVREPPVPGVGRDHAAAVVDHSHQAAAAALDLDDDGARAGVEGVLAQLLDHRRGPLHHLARRDLIDHGIG